MNFIEEIGIGEERTAAGFGAEIDGPAAILDAEEICWIGFLEFRPHRATKRGYCFCLKDGSDIKRRIRGKLILSVPLRR